MCYKSGLSTYQPERKAVVLIHEYVIRFPKIIPTYIVEHTYSMECIGGWVVCKYDSIAKLLLWIDCKLH